MDLTPTNYGFKWGALEVERSIGFKDGKQAGAVILTCRTPKTEINIYVTKTGKLRVFNPDGTEWHNGRIYP